MAFHYRFLFITLSFLLPSLFLSAEDVSESDSIPMQSSMSDVVVTGSRMATQSRHLPFSISSVTREELTLQYRPNILPTLMEQVPGLMITSRGVM